MRQNAVLRFLALTFAIGWLFQLIAIRFGIQGAGHIWLIATMGAPLLASVIVREARASVWAGLKRAGFKYWAVALAAGWSFNIVQQLLLWITKGAEWNARNFPLRPDHSGIEQIRHVGMALGVGSQGISLFAVNLLVSVSLGSIVSMVAAVGEEAGWRGFLQLALLDRFGWIKSTLLIGLVWGLWHLPVNLAGYNDPTHPILEALIIFQIHTVAMSFVFACLMKKTHSIWIVALAHGANNTLQSGPLLVGVNWYADQLAGIIASVLLGAVACAVLYYSTAKRRGRVRGPAEDSLYRPIGETERSEESQVRKTNAVHC